MDIWQWYLDGSNAAKVAKLCARLNGKDSDENFGRVLDAMIAHGNEWIEKHDPARAQLTTYLLMNIGYALYDKPKNIPQERFLTDQEAETLTYTSREDEPEVDDKLLSVLNNLSGYDKWLITARHVYKMSFSSIGFRCGVSKGLVRDHYLRAMNRAKRYL